MIKFAEQFDAADDLLLLLSALAALLIGAFAIGMLFNDLSARADEARETRLPLPEGARVAFIVPRQSTEGAAANDG